MEIDKVNYSEPELVIGLVGAVGIDLCEIERILTDRLKTAAYNTKSIRVSTDIIGRVAEVEDFDENDEYLRIKNYMDAGDEARRSNEDNSILALGVSAKISFQRHDISQPSPQTCYVINSLKHPAEVFKLRQIYPGGFYLIGVYSDKIDRKKFLVGHKRMDSDQADNLIKRDEDGQLPYGQKVADTFHMSDFFIKYEDDKMRLTKSLWRIVDILFGNPHITPIFDEYAMFLAYAASLSSGDLSRQVGAVIAKNEDILSVGANDCPKYGGGRYWPFFDPEEKKVVDKVNGRDSTRGYDSNADELRRIIEGIVKSAEEKGIDPISLRDVLNKSRIVDVTEYGRVVHAEMEALLSCARNNVSTRGADLYCTTFPCHNCTKHIIAAGIKRVVYVEPYQKSKAAEFHDDAICINLDPGNDKINFEPFIGVGPRRFFDFFSVSLGSGRVLKRKDEDGNKIDWKLEDSRLRLQMQESSYLDFELIANKRFLMAEQKKEANDERKGGQVERGR